MSKYRGLDFRLRESVAYPCILHVLNICSKKLFPVKDSVTDETFLGYCLTGITGLTVCRLSVSKSLVKTTGPCHSLTIPIVILIEEFTGCH